MAERYGVLWTEAATQDLEDLAGYVATESPLRARDLLERLRASIQSLSRTPRRGRTVPELAMLGLLGRREMIRSPYRIVYRVEKRTVLVLAVLDGRRDLQDLLLERLLRHR